MSTRTLAKKLGVSATTVSLALKDSPRISSTLRAKIQVLAKAAGYVPNARITELMNEVRSAKLPTYRATLGAISLYPSQTPWREPQRAYLKVLLDSARERAELHGYKLEYFWVKEPNMRAARLCSILESRGIKGLFCLGSLDPEEPFPADLHRFAVVTQGATISGKLHRVASHFMHDGRTLFFELARRGYRHPGMVILTSGDRRTDYAYSATYLSMQERIFTGLSLPILRAETWEAAQFTRWFETYRPDVIVLHQSAGYLAEVRQFLKRRRLRVPRDIGIALLDSNPDQDLFSGMCQDYQAVGPMAIEMLIGRVLLRDFGEPTHPKTELVEGYWNEGRTLRARPKKDLLALRSHSMA